MVTEIPNQDELKEAELSAKKASAFANTYHVITQYNDATGLSATVFTDADNNTFLAIRGTVASDPMDLLTDWIDITWLGSTALQPQYISLRSKVAEWLENGNAPAKFHCDWPQFG